MNFIGIGGLEVIVVFLIALLVVGPQRLVHGARAARKYMTELRRQREELTQMVEEAVDMEGIRESLDQDGLLEEVRDLTDELRDFRDDARSVTSDVADFKSLARSVVRPSGYSKSEVDDQSHRTKVEKSAEDAINTKSEGTRASS